MAIVREASASTNGAASTSLTITKPTGTAAGDVLVATIQLTGSTAMSPPTGWTAFFDAFGAAASDPSIGAWYRVATSTEGANYKFTGWSAANSFGGINRYSGVSSTSPVVTTATTFCTSTQTAVTVPQLTGLPANTMLVSGCGINTGTMNLSLTGEPVTEVWDEVRCAYADGTKATTGASGTVTWDSTGVRKKAAWLSALRPTGGSSAASLTDSDSFTFSESVVLEEVIPPGTAKGTGLLYINTRSNARSQTGLWGF